MSCGSSFLNKTHTNQRKNKHTSQGQPETEPGKTCCSEADREGVGERSRDRRRWRIAEQQQTVGSLPSMDPNDHGYGDHDYDNRNHNNHSHHGDYRGSASSAREQSSPPGDQSARERVTASRDGAKDAYAPTLIAPYATRPTPQSTSKSGTGPGAWSAPPSRPPCCPRRRSGARLAPL